MAPFVPCMENLPRGYTVPLHTVDKPTACLSFAGCICFVMSDDKNALVWYIQAQPIAINSSLCKRSLPHLISCNGWNRIEHRDMPRNSVCSYIHA